MSQNPKTLRTRILAGAAVLTLSTSVVACSQAEDAADSAGGAVSSATDSAGSALNEATGENAESESAESEGADSSTAESESAESESAESESAESESAESEGAGGGSSETTEVESADGSTLEIPTAVASAAEEAGFSAPESVENGSNGDSLVTYAEGLITHSQDAGAQPLVGKIAETWVEEGGLEAGVGLPTAPEESNSEGNGWTQEFTKGVISWVDDGSGEFTADVQAS